jgi:chromosome segregation ATPase
MLYMTTHNENLTRVQQELWHLINDEYVERILEAMIEKMKKVEDSFERVKQWRQEAKSYIPDDQKYEENYWIAAYILYTNEKYLKYLFEDFDELDSIRQEISKLWDEIKDLRHKKEKLEERIKNLRDELKSLTKDKENKVVEDLLCEIDKCEEDLEDTLEKYHNKLNRFYDLSKNEYYRLLSRMMKRAEQLVAL